MFEMLFSRYGKDYWEQKILPGHRRETADFYEEHAADLRLLFAKYRPQKILELCCGNGALYSHLGFDEAEYKGVDFSPTMLGVFAKSHPGVNLEEADVVEYVDDQQYDLILLEFAAQHFEIGQLAHVFEHVRSMMHSHSVFVCSSVPWKRARWDFYGGMVTTPYKRNLYSVGKAKAMAVVRIKDVIGT